MTAEEQQQVDEMETLHKKLRSYLVEAGVPCNRATAQVLLALAVHCVSGDEDDIEYLVSNLMRMLVGVEPTVQVHKIELDAGEGN